MTDQPRYCIDGLEFDDPDAAFTGDGQFAPFVIFDIFEQMNLPGEFATRAEAEAALDKLLQAKPPRYNHAYDLAFTLISEHPQGEDVTPEMFRAALMKRIEDLDRHNEWQEACGCPFDTYLEDE